MSRDEEARLVHDTHIVIEVSAALCRLFRCEREDLIDRSIADLIAREDFRWLSGLRMVTLRKSGFIRPQRFPFRRFDGTCFWALAQLVGRRANGCFEFALYYEYDDLCL